MLQDSSVIFRVKRFLSDILPFSYMSGDQLDDLARQATVRVKQAGESIFDIGQATEASFFVVRKGAVDILDESSGVSVLIDKCGEADIFGIRPLLAQSLYEFSAVAREPSILYAIDIEVFKRYYLDSPEAVQYMMKRFAAGRVKRDTYLVGEKTAAIVPTIVMRHQADKPLVTAPGDSTIQAAVTIMSNHKVSSVVITDQSGCPAGIITDRDVRDLVATGYNPDLPLSKVMTSPVQCVRIGVTLQEAQLSMIDSGLHHLCITEDGTADTPGVGMITEHDILYANASDPVVIIKQLKRATDVEHLIDARSKLDALLPAFLEEVIDRKVTLSLIDKLNSAIISQAVELALSLYNTSHKKIDKSTFSFYTMGSAARGEQLFMTDQDNGLLVDDAYESMLPAYRQLGKMINDTLAQIGYVYCPAGMMAGSAAWCTTVSQMKTIARRWILSPGPDEVLRTAIFFDFRHEYGNRDYSHQVASEIAGLLQEQDLYIRFLAKQSITNPPPLSFFRRFIIETDGAYRDQFDVKLRGIAPLTDSARVLALESGYMLSSRTIDRFDHLSKIDAGNAALYYDASQALLTLLAARLRDHLDQGGDGRYIDPSKISKMNRIALREAFKPGAQLIDMLERRFSLSFI